MNRTFIFGASADGRASRASVTMACIGYAPARRGSPASVWARPASAGRSVGLGRRERLHERRMVRRFGPLEGIHGLLGVRLPGPLVREGIAQFLQPVHGSLDAAGSLFEPGPRAAIAPAAKLGNAALVILFLQEL